MNPSKAFVTVNNKILLTKCKHSGIRGIAHGGIKNYLENRKQYIVYKNASSDLNTVKCGVPRGSIFGPLLLLLYVNDIV